MTDSPLGRRDLLAASAVVAAGLPAMAHGAAQPAADPLSAEAGTAADMDIALDVNGAQHRLRVAANTTLLDALRDHIGLTGTKKGCALGQCGACTVLLDGRRVNACLTFAVMQQGRAITTIEGLAEGATLHPLQAAFVEHDAFQCGYCTPGQIMSGVACIDEGHATDDAEIREWMSGNICRCGAYTNIVAAIRQAAGRNA